MTPTPDHSWGPPGPPPRPARSRLGRRLALATGVGAVLAVGGVAVAQAAGAPSASPSAPSASPSASGSAAPKAPKAPKERTPRLAGTVVSASGGTIVITDLQGFQRTIRTTSSTTYEDGLTATPAAGTKILAAGTVDSDKTSLVATRVSKFPERVDGRGLPGHRHGGPGRGGPADPSGTPPAPADPSGTAPAPSPTK